MCQLLDRCRPVVFWQLGWSLINTLDQVRHFKQQSSGLLAYVDKSQGLAFPLNIVKVAKPSSLAVT